MDLETVADELYALAPQDFTEVRNARARSAKSAGDRQLAADITALRRPSTSAWAVNLLARERSDLVEQVLELADALRSAQETLSGPELRALSTQRHRVVASVVAEARKLAAGQGTKISDTVERELEATFDAALADPQAAEAVRSGRLSTALSYAGLGAAPTVSTAPAAPPKAGTEQAGRRAQARGGAARRRAGRPRRRARRPDGRGRARLRRRRPRTDRVRTGRGAATGRRPHRAARTGPVRCRGRRERGAGAASSPITGGAPGAGGPAPTGPRPRGRREAGMTALS